jgi:hypothetical protein
VQGALQGSSVVSFESSQLPTYEAPLDGRDNGVDHRRLEESGLAPLDDRDGHFDMAAHARFLAGALEDYEYPQSQIDAALRSLPPVRAG